jgi:endonuclease/exonuclease/phosphatase (EEP) superfamily protein YafD
MLDSVCDVNREVYFLGDLNIDSFSSCSPLKRELLTVNCNRVQVINQPTRVLTNTTGTRSSTCIDHIFTKTVELCSKDESVPIRCSDHNIVAISRKDTVPKAGPKIVYKRLFKI